MREIMRRWFSILVMAGIPAGVLSSCGGGQTLALKIIFPDQAAKLAVTSVSVWAISPTLQSSCTSLLRGDSKPGDTDYTVDAQVTFSMPYTGGDAPDPIKIAPPGRRLFLARAGVIGLVLLQGCTDLDTGNGGEVTVTLQWVSATCSSDSDCASGNYCNDSHRCVSCSPSDPRHCGTACLDCGDEGSCSSGICSTIDGGFEEHDGGGTVSDDRPPNDQGLPDGGDQGLSDCVPDCTGKCGGASEGCGGFCTDGCISGFWCENQICAPCESDAHCGTDCRDCTNLGPTWACLQQGGLYRCACATDGGCPD